MSGLMQEIRTRNQEFMSKFISKDANGCAEVYCQDCKFMPHGKDVVIGKDGNIDHKVDMPDLYMIPEVKKYFQQDMDEGVSGVTLNTEEVNGAGDWAFERGTYRLDGERGPETGAYLVIWKKAAGKWCIYTDCFNVVHPAQG